MTDAISHRGPDDSGCYISSDKKVGLGHRRLSIIDLSPLGHQPMTFQDSRCWMTFNGEIYNYQELRADLVASGTEFVSKSDSEVILALYYKHGVGCLQFLRGQFSLAIYDEEKQTLFCARDRIGKKPFKYYLDDNCFLFASELKAILTQEECPREPDYDAIHHYLTLMYCPSPMTGFKDIKKLDAAHYLLLDLNTGKAKIERYWKLQYCPDIATTEQEWIEKIRTELREATRLRMIAADVPVGAFLSGGIDSSAIVALMSEISNEPVKTYSIGFKEEKYNELPYAKMIADMYKTDHTEFVIEPNAVELLPMLVRQYEEPYADSSSLPTYYVSKLTRQHVTVALNGDGGDENFAGYTRYAIQKQTAGYDKFRSLHKASVLPASRAASKVFKNRFFERANRMAETLADTPEHRYVNYVCYFTNEMKKKLYSKDFYEKHAAQDSYNVVARRFAEAEASNPLDQMMYADFSTYLVDDLMVKVDIATMAVSLEGRSPFLDHKFMEMTAEIPFDLKLKGRNEKKYILKKALEGLVPDEILYRPKRGFNIPLEYWFRNDLKQYMYDVLLSPEATSRGIFNPDEVKKMLDTHSTTSISYSKQIWAMINLELWFREFFG